MARIEVTSKGFSVYSYREYPLSQDPNHDRQIELIEILRSVRSEDPSGECRYVIGMPQRLVSTRLKTFPFKERLKIVRATPFELEDDIPLEQDDAIFEAKIARYRGAGADAICFAAPREDIKKLLESVNEGGVHPTIVSVESSAYANTIEDWMSAPPSFGASEEFQLDANTTELGSGSAGEVYLHLGHSSTLMTVYQNRRLVAARSFQWGGRMVAEAISRKMQTPLSEALKIVQTKAFILTNAQGANKDQQAFSAIITDAFKSLVAELRLSLLELRTDLNIPVSQIYITGGVAQIPNLAAYLTQVTEVAVNTFNHLSKYSQMYLDQTGSVPFTSNVAVGLAIEGAKRPRNPAVNLRKQELAGEGQNFKLFWEKWRHTAQVAAAAIAVIFVYGVLRESFARNLADQAENTLREQAKNLANLKGTRASESNIRKFVADKEKDIKAREMLEEVKGLSSALDILKKFNDLVPRKDQLQVDIRQWILQKDSLSVEGSVANPSQLELLRGALRTLASDSQVNSQNMKEAVPVGRTGFSFRIKVQRNMQR